MGYGLVQLSQKKYFRASVPGPKYLYEAREARIFSSIDRLYLFSKILREPVDRLNN